MDLADKNPTIAPTLMKFQRGCHQVRLTDNLDRDNQRCRAAQQHSDCHAKHRTLNSQLSTQKLTQTSSQL